MARAYKCDICGHLYSVDKIAKKLFGTKGVALFERSISGVNHEEETFDVCPDCYMAIKKTIDARRKTVDPMDDDLK